MRSGTLARLLLVPLALAALAAPALADVAGGDFDPIPPGPYPFTGPTGSPRILGGDPARVQVVPAGSEVGAPTIPQGSGNVLCIDNRNSSTSIILEFDFACGESLETACTVTYDYTAAAWSFGAGFDVHLDAGGNFNNPFDLYRPPVGFPPSTVQGTKTKFAGDCDGAMHTLTFRIFPDGVLYLDNMVTDCVDFSTPALPTTWGRIKDLYR